MLLAGDIGGTKTVLALISATNGPRAPVVERVYPSAAYSSLAAVVQEFLAQTGAQVEKAAFGVAGPVVGGTAHITNLPWVLDERQLAETLHCESVRLYNDLESIAYSVPILTPEDLHTINPGRPQPHGVMGIVAPGTGLGEAFLTWDGDRYQPHASEGGHCDFAPRDERELELLRYLLRQHEHVSYERVCSGIGIPNLYAFLRDSRHAPEPAWLAARLSAQPDPTPAIVAAAMDPKEPCELCVETVELFACILGGEAGNLALKVLATGGIFIGGGIPPRILPFLEQDYFLENFRDKGRMGKLLVDVPIHVILNPKAALYGAACAGLQAG